MNPPEASFDMTGIEVFVIEDESLVAMQLEDMLFDMGCEVLELAMRLNQAHAFVDAGKMPQVAILDVNIGGEPVYPLARRFRDAGVPIIFATGYGLDGVEAEWRTFPVLQKPYTEQQIEQSLNTALRSARG